MFDEIWSWIAANGTLATAVALASVVMFLGTLIALPQLAVRIPPDYFVDPERHASRLHTLHPAVFVVLVVLKNLVGWLLVLIGLAMLVLPGQGLLTILVGLLLSDFPGKFRLERWVACQAGVLKAINWLRRRAGRVPLQSPKRPDGTDCAG